ncbi:hypothetical protein [Umezawaea sp. NPDC059074]|uniref:Rv0361 family membrane protein n=1 Tax=Umezawaea sp. NPDC059074 TaxID=3346716 RepID=UPI0036B71D02
MVVLLVLGGGAAFFLLKGGSAKAVAESMVSELNKGKDMNVDTLLSLSCKADADKIKELPKSVPSNAGEQFKDIKTEFAVTDVKESGDTATATLTVKFSNVPEEFKSVIKDDSTTMKLLKEDGDWKVCGTFNPDTSK